LQEYANVTLTRLNQDPRVVMSSCSNCFIRLTRIWRNNPEGLTQKIITQKDRIEGEKKQVTVMFCDLVGFTSMSEKLDPEETYAIMDQILEILIHKVNDFGGTVNKMLGDGIMALFGARIALEDGPQRAIRSAMEVHKEITRFSEKIRQDYNYLTFDQRWGLFVQLPAEL
jgi:class 3 adenylate cyclase